MHKGGGSRVKYHGGISPNPGKRVELFSVNMAGEQLMVDQSLERFVRLCESLIHRPSGRMRLAWPGSQKGRETLVRVRLTRGWSVHLSSSRVLTANGCTLRLKTLASLIWHVFSSPVLTSTPRCTHSTINRRGRFNLIAPNVIFILSAIPSQTHKVQNRPIKPQLDCRPGISPPDRTRTRRSTKLHRCKLDLQQPSRRGARRFLPRPGS